MLDMQHMLTKAPTGLSTGEAERNLSCIAIRINDAQLRGAGIEDNRRQIGHDISDTEIQQRIQAAASVEYDSHPDNALPGLQQRHVH
jgi:hypothetical protein